MEGVSFIVLHLEGADPNGHNKSTEECVELAKKVAEKVTMPIVIMGCKNIEKDAEIFGKVSEALTGKNILVLSAREENYKTVGASAVPPLTVSRTLHLLLLTRCSRCRS